MFEWLENIWNGIKTWCEWFGSTVGFGVKGFQILGQIIQYPISLMNTVTRYIPAYVLALFMLCLFVQILSIVLGRRGN